MRFLKIKSAEPLIDTPWFQEVRIHPYLMLVRLKPHFLGQLPNLFRARS